MHTRTGICLLIVAGLLWHSLSCAEPKGSPAAQVINESGPSADGINDFLDQFMPAQLARSGIPGAVVVVVTDAKVLAAKGYGLADIASRRRMTSDRTLTNIASIKKLFEGIAIMQLVERGRLDLDQDVNSYLDFRIPTPAGGVPVTLRRLMTHRGGFEDWFKTTHAPLAEQLPPRLFPDGDVPAYSNYGAALMTYILARAAGQPAQDYVSSQVLAPLGMNSSSFGLVAPPTQPQGPTDIRALLATGYLLKPGASPAALQVTSTDLQLYATGDDMGRFMRAILGGGALDGRRVLGPETLAVMMAPQVSEPLSVMGLNFYQRKVSGATFIGHRGDTSTFQVDLMLLPELKMGLFVAYNAEADGQQRDELERALVARYLSRPTSGTATFVPRPADAATVAGWYEHTRRSETNLFSVEELFTQRRIRANADGSISSRTAGLFAPAQSWVRRGETAPFVYADSAGEQWAFESKRRGLEILETADGTSGRERVAWYRAADFVQPMMALSLAIMCVGITVAGGAALWQAVRRGRGASPTAQRGFFLLHAALLPHLLGASAVIFLVIADWDQRQIFVDALDPWLLVLYAVAWLAVLITPVALWQIVRICKSPGASGLLRAYLCLLGVAMMVSASFALGWHVAGTTLKY
jgi:CubicO group peptidase (beta-lactamase class C family)